MTGQIALTQPAPSMNFFATEQGFPRPCSSRAQHGVVLIIALVLLVVISLLAVSGMRTAGSSERTAGNVRTTELATQAAEIALRHCESSVLKIQRNASGDTTSPEATYPTTFTSAKILPATNPPGWQNKTTWDGSSTAVYVLPESLLNQGLMTATYKRFPECMVESLPVLVEVAGSPVAKTNLSFVITARGFGPEVAALLVSSTRVRPVGAEVWLQSHIELE